MEQQRGGSLRVRRGHVKFNVRRHALELGAFTIADIVQATQLNAKSVRTELKRMQGEGLLTGQSTPGKSGKRGAPPTLYKLTDDPEARSAIAQSLEDLTSPRSPGARPTSPHYLAARQLLNYAQLTFGAVDRERSLAAAEQHLVMAAEAEGGDRAPDRVMLYLAYEEARLSCLSGAGEEAARRVAALRERSAGLQDDPTTHHLEELHLYLEANSSFVAQCLSTEDELAWAHCLLDTLAAEAYQPESPLAALLLAMLSRIVGRSGPERMQRFLYAELPMLQPLPTPAPRLTKTQAGRAAMAFPWSCDEAALHLRKARAAFQLERYDEALISFDRAISVAPAHARPIAARGEAYRRLERYDEALADFNRAIELEPDYAWAIAERGHVHRVRGRYDEAAADFDRTIALEPDYAWAIAERGHLHRARGRYGEALPDFDRAIALDPDDPWLVASRGQLHRANRRCDEALEDFSRAVAQAPDEPWLVTSRGQLYRVRGRYDEALADFDRAIELGPDVPWAIAERAQVYRLLGRDDVAQADFKRAEAVQPIQQVRRDLEKFLAIIPSDHPEAPTMRALLERVLLPGASWKTMYEAAVAA